MPIRIRVLLLALLTLNACGPQPLKDTGPTISELAKSRPPSSGAVIAPAPVPAPSPGVTPPDETALENYKRIAELATDPETKAEANRRLADLQVQIKEQQLVNDESTAAQKQSVELYDQLLKDRGDNESEGARLLYQKARAQQNLGEFAASAESLKQLIERFPRSEYTGEAHFRRAEMLYRAEDFVAAEAEYALVIADPQSKAYYEPAQYKLGWSLFKQAKYEAALSVSFDILDRELPQGELSDPTSTLKDIAPGKRELAQDALRVASLALANTGGGDALNQALARRSTTSRYSVLLYNALGGELLDKKRYTDAAKTYLAFADGNPRHPLAPQYHHRAIEALRSGNFVEQVVAAKARYVATYDPSTSYWSGRPASPEVLGELRKHLDDLGRFHHNRARADKAADKLTGREDFLAAARYYQRSLDLFPKDAKAGELSVLLADALQDGGDLQAAAKAYESAVSIGGAKADDAAYAAVLAYQKLVEDAPENRKDEALRKATQAGLRFAEGFPGHPQTLVVLTRAAEDLYRLKETDQAVGISAKVIKSRASDDLKRTAWGVVADAQFTQKRYPEAEAAYGELLKLSPASDPQRAKLVDQLAAAIYKQGEAARSAGNQPLAAAAFQRVGQLAPSASIRATADYDAAAALIASEQWSTAGRLLENFRSANPGHALLPDVDKKLAVVYQKTSQPQRAAEVMARIAGRSGESADTRREAAWSQVTLLDQTRDPNVAEAYDNYLKNFGGPFERAIEARHRLAELAQARGNSSRREHWLRELIAADAAGGRDRSDRSRFLSAQAQLELGRNEAALAMALSLKQPLEKSVARKKAAMEKAIAILTRAADFGFAEVTTAATYELGSLYSNFSRALLDSERPKKLSALEKEQYSLLLEEQAFPFEEKAIEWHLANLKRVNQGAYDRWVSKSADALAQISPGKYGKREKTGGTYDELR